MTYDDDDMLPDPPPSRQQFGECHVCREEKPVEEMLATFPNPGWNTCRICDSRLNPRCECGCKQPARIVADIRWEGGVDCRAPFVDLDHALKSVSDHVAERPNVDIILDEHDLPRVISLVHSDLSPCWCDMEAMSCFHGYEYHTRLAWCPKHGAKE